MDLSNRELFYIFDAITSLMFSSFFRLFNVKNLLKYALSLVGTFQIIIFCGLDSVYFFVMLMIAIWLITKNKVKNPQIIFIFCFGYRVFFCCVSYLGLPRSEDNLANALLLVGTLKLIVLAYEVFDFQEHANKEDSDNYKTFGVLILKKEPCALDIFCYMTSCCGLFTGPLFKYRTYVDMLTTPYQPVSKFLTKQLKKLAFLLVLFLLGSHFLNLNYFKNSELQSDSVILRCFYIFPIGLLFQIQFALLWSAAECSCIMLGLGMYPVKSVPLPGKGPTAIPDINPTNQTPDFNFKTIENISLHWIASPSAWKAMRLWNCCVQWWFSHFIYQNSVLPKQQKFFRAMVTLFMSALWQGTSPGYFISYSVWAYAAFVEKGCLSFEKKYIQEKWFTRMYMLIQWILIKTPITSSFIICHVLLDRHLIWNFFVSTYFVTFISPLTMLCLCELCRLSLNMFSKAKGD